MSEHKTSVEAKKIDAQVLGTREQAPSAVVWWSFVDTLVSFVPTYRNTREGRKKKKQMQVLIVALGIGLLIVGGTADQLGWFWLILGMLVACLAFIAPIERMEKRTIRGELKARQKPREVDAWLPGKVDVSPRRVEVYEGDDRVHRVRIDRDKHRVVLRKWGERPCMGILPPGEKKKESIWICTDAVSGKSVGEGEAIEAEAMKSPARVDSKDWKELWQALGAP